MGIYHLTYSNRGGMKESGIGRENGVEALNACKWVSLIFELFSLLC
jgi:hypothetical protein